MMTNTKKALRIAGQAESITAVDLREYDWIAVSSSAGKDSQAMLDAVAELARAQGVEDRVVVIHADLGRVEWQGTRELAEEQAAHYGFRFEAISRPQGDLLDQVRDRGMWPSSTARFCTSDHKRGQIQKVLVQLGRETKAAGGTECRILQCIGLRAQESSARAKRSEIEENKRASTKTRTVTNWHPILHWTTEDVWARIRRAGTRHHYAYDAGMPRLSCVFCIFAPKAALKVAGRSNRELLAEYVQVEAEIGHTFTARMAIAEVQAELEAEEQSGQAPAEELASWTM